MDMGRAVVTRMGRRHLFFMGDLKRKDSGKYSVEVKTEGGKITKEFELEIPGNSFSQLLRSSVCLQINANRISDRDTIH